MEEYLILVVSMLTLSISKSIKQETWMLLDLGPSLLWADQLEEKCSRKVYKPIKK